MLNIQVLILPENGGTLCESCFPAVFEKEVEVSRFPDRLRTGLAFSAGLI